MNYCQNEHNRNNNILNIIIYDERVDQKSSENDQKLLFQRYDFLDYIWE